MPSTVAGNSKRGCNEMCESPSAKAGGSAFRQRNATKCSKLPLCRDLLRRKALRFSALVIAETAIFGLFRRERPALGGRPGQGGWRRIGPP